MRCSTRNRSLAPSFTTSTPITEYRRPNSSATAFDTKALSPIIEQEALSGRKRSKSKDTPLDNYNSFVSGMPANTRKMKNESKMEGLKNVELRHSNKRESNFLEEFCMKNKKGVRRTSRIDAIVEEVFKESQRKSRSHLDFKVGDSDEEEALDEMIEKGRTSGRRLTRSSHVAVPNENELKSGTRIIEVNIDDVLNFPFELENINHNLKKAKTPKSGIDENYEQVMQNRDIEVNRISKRGSNRQPKRSKSCKSTKKDVNKENLVGKIMKGSHEVDLFLVKSDEKVVETKVPNSTQPAPEKMTGLGDDKILNNLNIRKRSQEDLPSGAKKKHSLFRDSFMPSENIKLTEEAESVVNTLEYLNSCNDWKKVKDMDGVSLKKIYTCGSVTHGMVKIDASKRLQKLSSSHQIFVVVDGLGVVNVNNCITKVGPGDEIIIKPGCEFEIQSRGRTKSLMLNYTKFVGSD